jgi:hypothetical protein
MAAFGLRKNYLEKLIRADNLKPILDRINIIRIEHKHAAKSLKSEERENSFQFHALSENFLLLPRGGGLAQATHAKWLNHKIISLLIDGSKPSLSSAFWHSFAWAAAVRRKGMVVSRFYGVFGEGLMRFI